MKDEAFAKLVTSIKEAGEIKAGHRSPSRTYEIRPPEIRMVRERLDVSQGEFAVMIGVSIRTLQNWEQGRRQPEGPAKALLAIASRNPTAVLNALHGRRTSPLTGWRKGQHRAALKRILGFSALCNPSALHAEAACFKSGMCLCMGIGFECPDLCRLSLARHNLVLRHRLLRSAARGE